MRTQLERERKCINKQMTTKLQNMEIRNNGLWIDKFSITHDLSFSIRFSHIQRVPHLSYT